MRWYRGLRGNGADILIDTIDEAGDDDEGRRLWATKDGDLVFEVRNCVFVVVVVVILLAFLPFVGFGFVFSCSV